MLRLKKVKINVKIKTNIIFLTKLKKIIKF